MPNRGPRTAADNDDDDDDVPDATDFDNECVDDADSQGSTIAFNGKLTSSHGISYSAPISSFNPSFQHYHHTIDPQQEDICLQTLGLQPTSFATFEEGYALNDMTAPTVQVPSNWNLRANGVAPMMEQSFSAPGRMAMSW